MPLMLEWGEEIDLSCICVAETVFLTLFGVREKLLAYIVKI